MGFGNPYGNEWNVEIVQQWTEKLIAEGIKIIALSDTVGIATPQQISDIYPALCKSFPNTEFGLHLHATPNGWRNKIEASYKAGCKRFDSAIKGYGGCPMAADELTGNIATENLISYLQSQNENLGLNMDKFREAMEYSTRVFI